MSMQSVGVLCKCGRKQFRSLAGEPRRIFSSRDRSVGSQRECRRTLMILNPSGRAIRSQNFTAPSPPQAIPPEEDKVLQVMKIIQNLEIQKSASVEASTINEINTNENIEIEEEVTPTIEAVKVNIE